MVKQTDKARRPANVEVGDWVYLKIKLHRQTSMPSKLHPKLAARYFGPFQVTQKIGEVAFKLQLPDTARIHPVFHVSQLKKAVGERSVEKELPTDLQVEGRGATGVNRMARGGAGWSNVGRCPDH
ncbi:uncharacterized protein LOC108328599 [Vigna angularis]|uniref:uncharacterized protein LOC108328599 n=1 Tax=Phaseolus angularis TaxID=3914 RepID=UPI000809B781|nr:uncharacterized protein LOC108328599 [Vigna angularis]